MKRQDLRRQLARVARRLVRPFGIFDLSVVYAMDLRHPPEPYHAAVPIEIAVAGPADVDEIVALNPYHDRSVITGRMKAGAKCFVARIGGRIVGFNWIAVGRVRDDDFQVTLGDGEVYCLDARVVPEYRGNGIHTALLFAMLDHARSLGFAVAYTRVSAMHRDSWKTHLRLGWREIGTTFFFRPHAGIAARFALVGPCVYPVEVHRGA